VGELRVFVIEGVPSHQTCVVRRDQHGDCGPASIAYHMGELNGVRYDRNAAACSVNECTDALDFRKQVSDWIKADNCQRMVDSVYKPTDTLDGNAEDWREYGTAISIGQTPFIVDMGVDTIRESGSGGGTWFDDPTLSASLSRVREEPGCSHRRMIVYLRRPTGEAQGPDAALMLYMYKRVRTLDDDSAPTAEEAIGFAPRPDDISLVANGGTEALPHEICHFDALRFDSSFWCEKELGNWAMRVCNIDGESLNATVLHAVFEGHDTGVVAWWKGVTLVQLAALLGAWEGPGGQEAAALLLEVRDRMYW